jgi:hypothetical protein
MHSYSIPLDDVLCPGPGEGCHGVLIHCRFIPRSYQGFEVCPIVVQTAVISRADAPAPMPLFSDGGQSAFGSPQTAPVFSGNTSTAFPSNQDGVSAPPGATLRPTSRPTPGVQYCATGCCLATYGGPVIISQDWDLKIEDPKRTACKHAGKAHEALERQTDDSESLGAWHIPAGPRQDASRGAKMGRREAWARFLAYDVSSSFRLCTVHISRCNSAGNDVADIEWPT